MRIALFCLSEDYTISFVDYAKSISTPISVCENVEYWIDISMMETQPATELKGRDWYYSLVII